MSIKMLICSQTSVFPSAYKAEFVSSSLVHKKSLQIKTMKKFMDKAEFVAKEISNAENNHA